MAALAANRKVDMGTFMLDHSTSSSHSTTSTKAGTANGDITHDQASPNALMDNKSASTSKSTPTLDDRTDDLENSTHTKVDNLPPEKQLGKLKRFLQTVFSFAEKLPAQKERVKQLMVDLINADVSAQDFYTELRGSTKFPLRPFVVPFLESSLPLLRTSLVLPLKADALDTELFGASSGLVGSGGLGHKKAADRTSVTQNGLDRKRRATATSPDRSASPLSKRSHFTAQQTSVPVPSSSRNSAYPNLLAAAAGLVNGNNCSTLRGLFPNTLVPVTPGNTSSTTPVQKITNGNGSAATPVATTASGTNGLAALSAAAAAGGRPGDVTANASAFQHAGNGNQANLDWWTCQTDEWRNIETLFTTMATTMERLRYALLLFQQRARLTQLWNEKFQQHQRLHDSSMKIEEMQRKADAAVQEVKRAAVSELQKAVHAAEQKALHMIATERAQMEKLLRDTQFQEDSNESCRNCGRRAGQTCSGCGKARYCGVFCQHKDWPRHRASCSGGNESNSLNESDFSTGRAINGSASTDESRSPPTSSITVKTEFSPIEMSIRKDRVSPKSV